MKKTVFGLLILLGGALGVLALNGITPVYMVHAPGVASGIGAKLLCSSRYVSGFSREQSFDDLVQYSPALEYLSVDYDEDEKTVTASFLGISRSTASHVPGIGCAIEYPGYEQRQQFRARELPALASRWPHGDRVGEPDEDMQALLERQLERDNSAGLNTRALLVVHEGRILAETYAQGADADTPLPGWSMTKSMTSVMLGNLALRGRLDPQASPGFEQWADDGRAAIHTKHLLTMTDGLAFSERYSPGDDATEMLFTEASASDYALSRPLEHEPGTRFNYSSGTASILSRLYYERTGGGLQSSYRDYINHVVLPLSLQNAVFEVHASGVFAGSSYLYASARDWARLGRMMANGGVLNGQRVVSEDWVRQSTSPNDSENGPAYGYQWWLNRGGAEPRWPSLPADAFAAQGNREQRLMIIPSRDLVIVRLGWTSGRYPTDERFAEILDAL